MFSRTSVSGVDNEHSDEEYAENYEDDLADLNFSMAIIEEKKSKKKKIKKLRSRKEVPFRLYNYFEKKSLGVRYCGHIY